MEHQKGPSGLVKIRGHIEAVGDVPYHFYGILQSSGTGSAPVQDGDVGIVRVHGEADIRVPHVFLWQVTGNQARSRWDGTWWQEGAERVLKAVGTQDIRT